MLPSLFAWKRRPENGYDLQPIRAPRLARRSLRWAYYLSRTPGIGRILSLILLKNIGLGRLRKRSLTQAPTFRSVHPPPSEAPDEAKATASRTRFQDWCAQAISPSDSGFFPETVADFAHAYRSGRTTPLKVAQRLLDVIRNLESSAVPLRPLVAWDEENLLRQAHDATQRLEAGTPFGLWDGVPVAIKDEFHLNGLPTQVGTRLFEDVVRRDTSVVGTFRKEGALLIGKAHMQELGLGVNGYSSASGIPRNPYNPECFPGGSSGGSAVAVAAGLCPVALSADAGGSIRVPASLCGLAGLKPTWGRVSTHGKVQLGWTLGHVGPIGATVRDTALAYALIGGASTEDPWTRFQPPITLPDPEQLMPQPLRLGVFPPWFESAHTDVLDQCQGALQQLEELGAERREVRITSLDTVRSALLVTLLSETSALAQTFRKQWKHLNREALMNLHLTRWLRSGDYLQAQRVRTALLEELAELFEDIDLLVTPSTAITAPRIREDVQESGESDLATASQLIQFMPPASLSGYPALTLPVGYTPGGMPVGLQLMAAPWQEALLLGVGMALEAQMPKQPPMLHYRLLPQ